MNVTLDELFPAELAPCGLGAQGIVAVGTRRGNRIASSLAALGRMALGLAFVVQIATKLFLDSAVLMIGIEVVNWPCEFEAESAAAKREACDAMAFVWNERCGTGFRTRAKHPPFVSEQDQASIGNLSPRSSLPL